MIEKADEFNSISLIRSWLVKGQLELTFALHSNPYTFQYVSKLYTITGAYVRTLNINGYYSFIIYIIHSS